MITQAEAVRFTLMDRVDLESLANVSWKACVVVFVVRILRVLPKRPLYAQQPSYCQHVNLIRQEMTCVLKITGSSRIFF